MIPGGLAGGHIAPIPLLADVDGDDIESITLTRFSQLARVHAQHNKDLILARVKTTDMSSRIDYYDVYLAHALNRVLFRIYPIQEKEYLHGDTQRGPISWLDRIISRRLRQAFVQVNVSSNSSSQLEASQQPNSSLHYILHRLNNVLNVSVAMST